MILLRPGCRLAPVLGRQVSSNPFEPPATDESGAEGVPLSRLVVLALAWTEIVLGVVASAAGIGGLANILAVAPLARDPGVLMATTYLAAAGLLLLALPGGKLRGAGPKRWLWQVLPILFVIGWANLVRG